MCGADVGICPPLCPSASWAPGHRELSVFRMARLALSEHVKEPGKKGVVGHAAGEAGNPLPGGRDRCMHPMCGSELCWGFPVGEQGGAVISPGRGGISMLATLLLSTWVGEPGLQRESAVSGACPRPAGAIGVSDPQASCKVCAVSGCSTGCLAWMRAGGCVWTRVCGGRCWLRLTCCLPASWRYNCVAQTIKKIVLPS